MTRDEFIRNVRSHAPGDLPGAALDQATKLHIDSGKPLRDGDIPDVIQDAGRIAPNLELAPTKTEVALVGPREVISSDLICDALEPRVRGLRQRLFGATKPRFRSSRSAAKWIESTSATKPKKAVQAAKRWKLLQELWKLPGPDIRLETRVLEYPYSHKGVLIVKSVPVWRGEKLYELAVESERIASHTGFSQTAIVWWVLLGRRPLLPRVRVSSKWSQVYTGTSTPHIGRSHVTLEINAQDLSWRELWSTYQGLRTIPNAKRQTVNGLHYRIYKIVRELGGVPETGKTSFWKTVQKQLRQERRKNVPGTWQAIRKAYHATIGDAGVRQLPISANGFANQTRRNRRN